MSVIGIGRLDWSVERDEEGHRTYQVKHLVEVSNTDDGPQIILNAPGLPVIGAYWTYGNDFDPWARCWPTVSVQRSPAIKEGHPGVYWVTEHKFSTKPFKRCQDTNIEDPLLEPQKVSGSFVKYSKEAERDRNGNIIKTRSHEMIRGRNVEFDAHRASMRVEQNVANLQLPLLTELMNHVNDAPLWGLPARCVKLSNAPWERKVYGVCSFYYTRTLEFDIDFNTWDRDVLDEGTKVLKGHWGKTDAGETEGVWYLENIGGSPPDPDNPAHYIAFADAKGNLGKVILDSDGTPWDHTGTGDPPQVHVEYYPEANLLQLGIPIYF